MFVFDFLQVIPTCETCASIQFIMVMVEVLVLGIAFRIAQVFS